MSPPRPTPLRRSQEVLDTAGGRVQSNLALGSRQTQAIEGRSEVPEGRTEMASLSQRWRAELVKEGAREVEAMAVADYMSQFERGSRRSFDVQCRALFDRARVVEIHLEDLLSRFVLRPNTSRQMARMVSKIVTETVIFGESRESQVPANSRVPPVRESPRTNQAVQPDSRGESERGLTFESTRVPRNPDGVAAFFSAYGIRIYGTRRNVLGVGFLYYRWFKNYMSIQAAARLFSKVEGSPSRDTLLGWLKICSFIETWVRAEITVVNPRIHALFKDAMSVSGNQLRLNANGSEVPRSAGESQKMHMLRCRAHKLFIWLKQHFSIRNPVPRG